MDVKADAELYKELEALEKQQAKISENHGEIRNKITTLQKQLKELKDTYESRKSELESEVSEQNQQMIEVAAEHNKLNPTISDLEQKISDQERTRSIDALIAKQPTFADTLLRQLTNLIEELQQEMVGIVELRNAEEATQNILNSIDSKQYSQELITLREGKSQYESKVKEICTRKYEGKAIDIRQGFMPSESVRVWLNNPAVMRYWRVS